MGGVTNRSLLLSIEAGDILQFFNKQNANLTERRVLDVRLDESTPPNKNGTTIVTIDGDVPGLIVGALSTETSSIATQVYNLNASATQFVFRGNRVRNGRRFGVLAKGLRLLIEDNSFEGLGSGAVQFLNTPVEGVSE